MRNILAFTLVEIATVMLVIGLLLSAIVVSNQLVDRGQVQAVIQRLENYKSSTNSFRSKYNYFPGDFPFATARIAGSTTNGNGDGIVGPGQEIGYSTTPPGTPDAEHLLFFRHMSEDGFIDFDFTSSSAPSMQLPLAKFEDTRLFFYYTGIISAHVGISDFLKFDHVWFIGYATSTDLSLTPQNPFTAEQAQSIDRKLDDGLPESGNAVSQGCAVNGYYNVLSKERNCNIWVKHE